jgi:transcriptional regulator with XRE-family HTH domain
MKLRDYLIEKGISQKEFAEMIDISRAHLSCIVSGHRSTSKKVARNIERETLGIITKEAVISGDALGYDGNPKRVDSITIKNGRKRRVKDINLRFEQKVLSNNACSLI